MVLVIFAPVNHIPVSAPFRPGFRPISEVIRPDGWGICLATVSYFRGIVGHVRGSFSQLLVLIRVNLRGLSDDLIFENHDNKFVKSKPAHDLPFKKYWIFLQTG